VLAALPVAGAVGGRVVTLTGKPVAKARVVALRRLSAEPTDRGQIVASAESDAAGVFALEVSGYGPIAVRVVVPGHAPADVVIAADEQAGTIPLYPAESAEGDQFPVDQPGNVLTEKLKKEAGPGTTPVRWIAGIVHDAAGHPLAGLGLNGAKEGGAVEAVTAADGTFRLPVARGKVVLTTLGSAPVYRIDPVTLTAESAERRLELVAYKRPLIEGTVRTIDGKPVARAPIGWSISLPEVGGLIQPAGIASDDEGRFRLRAPRPDGSMIVRVQVFQPGHPIALSEVVDERTKQVTITIPDGERVAGRVTDPSGHPLAGVTVEPESDLGSASAPALMWAVTDADGRFSGLLAPGSMSLDFAKQGYVSDTQVIEVIRRTPLLLVSLTPLGHLSGKVVQKDGTPRAGIDVAVGGDVKVLTAADGTFRFDEVAPGLQTINFSGGRQSKTLMLPADDVTLVLAPSRMVKGRVIDSVTGRPVTKFSALSYGSSRQPTESPSGEFELELTESEREITVYAEGYVRREVEVDAAPETMVVALTPARMIRGRVTDGEGKPLADAMIADERGSRLSTDEEGRFEGRVFDPGRELVLEFQEMGYLPESRKVEAGTGEVTLDVTLRRALEVKGRVVDAAGKPVPDCPITASLQSDSKVGDMEFSDAAGEFTFRTLTPGRWDFTAEHQEPRASGKLTDVDVALTRAITIRLERLPSATLTGHVSGLEKWMTMRYVHVQPLGNVSVMSAGGEIDAAGNFHVVDVPPGTVGVSAGFMAHGEARSSKTVVVDLTAGDEARVDLEILPPVTVRGRVTRGGKPWAGVVVSLASAGKAIAGPEGGYELEVEPGEYEVTFEENGKLAPYRNHISVSGPMTADFAYDPGELTVTVVDEQETPVAWAKVTATAAGLPEATATTAADGTARIEIPRGTTATVLAEQHGFGNASAEVRGGSSSVRLRLVRSEGVPVRLLDARSGRLLVGPVVARSLGGAVVASERRPGGDGVPRLPLAPGSYLFSGSAEGYGSATVRATVPSDEVRILLPRGGSLTLLAKTVLHGKARLLQADGTEYVRCWCNGVAAIPIEGAATLVDGIAPGAYTLEVTLSGASPRRIPVTVIEGITTPVSLD
jgi:protocatechuate 3,4-dioxygenase beta subunit